MAGTKNDDDDEEEDDDTDDDPDDTAPAAVEPLPKPLLVAADFTLALDAVDDDDDEDEDEDDEDAGRVRVDCRDDDGDTKAGGGGALFVVDANGNDEAAADADNDNAADDDDEADTDEDADERTDDAAANAGADDGRVSSLWNSVRENTDANGLSAAAAKESVVDLVRATGAGMGDNSQPLKDDADMVPISTLVLFVPEPVAVKEPVAEAVSFAAFCCCC